MAHVHAAALKVIDAVVRSEAVGGGYRLHASDNGLIGFLARVDIDAVAFGVVVVLKEREVEERVWRIVVAQVVERRTLDIDAAHAFYQAVARRQHQHAAALPVGERRVALTSPNSGNRIANSKGVHREVESERSWRQTSDLTYRNFIQGI